MQMFNSKHLAEENVNESTRQWPSSGHTGSKIRQNLTALTYHRHDTGGPSAPEY